MGQTRARPVRFSSLATAVLLAAVLSLSINWLYQVVRKPTELLFPVSGTFNKTPAQTWHEYAPLFKKYSTAVVSPGLLAALAQTEGSGNPIVRTYWRWSWTLRPFDVYRPASSSVGMYQLTNGTFAEARRFCIQNHTVVEIASSPSRCPVDGAYSRVVPADAVELTSAYLDRRVTGSLETHGLTRTSPRHARMLAALIHLCGSKAGDDYVQRGFRLLEHQRCGPHDARVYLARVDALSAVFDRLAAAAPET